jgi:hypothetical protein
LMRVGGRVLDQMELLASSQPIMWNFSTRTRVLKGFIWVYNILKISIYTCGVGLLYLDMLQCTIFSVWGFSKRNLCSINVLTKPSHSLLWNIINWFLNIVTPVSILIITYLTYLVNHKIYHSELENLLHILKHLLNITVLWCSKNYSSIMMSFLLTPAHSTTLPLTVNTAALLVPLLMQ